jgi:uncharacterized protein YbaP (TraB family)
VIESAFEQSAFLVVENDVSDPAALQRVMRDRGFYPMNTSLSQHVPKETAEAANAMATALGHADGSLERLKPWLVAAAVRANAIQESGFDLQQGVLRHFLDAAKKNAKPLLAMERPGIDFESLSRLPEEVQVMLLSESLKERPGTRERLQQELDTWRKGDLDALERTQAERRKKPAFADVYAKVFDEANARVAAKIAGYLKTRDRHFIVVDMTTLAGERGLLKLLERDGVTLEQVEAP